MTRRADTGAAILDELRAEGFKVQVRHHRKRRHAAAVDELTRLAFKIDGIESVKLLQEVWKLLPLEPNGGTTTVTICDANDVALATGFSDCRQDERFDRHLGLTIAAGRARKKLHAHLPF